MTTILTMNLDVLPNGKYQGVINLPQAKHQINSPEFDSLPKLLMSTGLMLLKAGTEVGQLLELLEQVPPPKQEDPIEVVDNIIERLKNAD